MAKSISLISFEALVVGVGLVLIYEIIRMLVSPKEKSNYMVLFLSGITFHFLFEFTGVNEWYSIKYCELLKK